ncbi:ParB family protein [Rahnella bonaserana]|jgi:ParB family transcriptional regulator, chromosome partitioning protein|uniref:ParB family protein n=1 Tax=Rahnella bonaserana TaxID=2816248 RepID=UPI00320B6F18
MSSKRTTIGRTFTQSLPKDGAEDEGYTQRFTLASGKTASFKLINVEAEKVESETFVTLETNGRDQSALTPESLKDITRTLKLQQFFPAIGRRLPQGIDILDGSRRRAGAILEKVGLNVLVTESDISASDARQLAADLQTAKEHNLREIGLRLQILRENGMSQKDIAHSEMLSEAKVTRAIQAASVPSKMLAPFPVQSELTYPDFKLLLDLHQQLLAKQIEVDDVVEKVNESKANLPDGLANDEFKSALIQLFKSVTTMLLDNPAKEKSITRSLWNFGAKDKFARRKTKGRLLSYEFNRLPKEVQDELDMVIQNTIEKHFKR